jgi:hypothetical protein
MKRLKNGGKKGSQRKGEQSPTPLNRLYGEFSLLQL